MMGSTVHERCIAQVISGCRYDFGRPHSKVVVTTFHWHAHSVWDLCFTTDGAFHILLPSFSPFPLSLHSSRFPAFVPLFLSLPYSSHSSCLPPSPPNCILSTPFTHPPSSTFFHPLPSLTQVRIFFLEGRSQC